MAKKFKSPKSTIDTALSTSAEIIKRIPDFPSLMDKAEYALKLVAEEIKSWHKQQKLRNGTDEVKKF